MSIGKAASELEAVMRERGQLVNDPQLRAAGAELEQAMREGYAIDPAPVPLSTRALAVTVRQPWAWIWAHAPCWPEQVRPDLAVLRHKTSWRGELWIHVGSDFVAAKIAKTLERLDALGMFGGARCPSRPLLEDLRGQIGQVIARCQVVGCRSVSLPDPHPWAWRHGWGWQLAHVELVMPFELGGRPGAWHPPSDITPRAIPHRRPITVGGIQHSKLKFRSHGHAARYLLASARRLADPLQLEGESITAGELLARAAEEHRDIAFADRVRSIAPKTCAASVDSCARGRAKARAS